MSQTVQRESVIMEAPFTFVSYALLGLAHLGSLHRREYAIASVLAIIIFIAFGSMLGAWANPLSLRSSAMQASDIWLLAAEAVVLGLFLALRHKLSSVPIAGLGFLFTLFAIVCPICSTAFDAVFGHGFLSDHFGGLCLYSGLIGITVSLLALIWKSAHAAFQQLLKEDLLVN